MLQAAPVTSRIPPERSYRAFAGLLGALLLWPAATAARADAANPETAYRLGPDDIVTITVRDNPDLSGDFTLYPDGSIDYPLPDQLSLQGLSVPEGEQRLRALLEKYLHDPGVSLQVKEYRSQKVTLVDEVGQSGIYYLDRPLKLRDLLIRADGFSKHFAGPGRIRRAQVVRPLAAQGDSGAEGPGNGPQELQIFDIDLGKLLAGSEEGNLTLRDGDLILVFRIQEEIHITGEVKKPGSYPYEEGMTVLKLVTLAGGKTSKAARKPIVALRLDENKEVVEVPLAMGDLLRPEEMIHVKKSFW